VNLTGGSLEEMRNECIFLGAEFRLKEPLGKPERIWKSKEPQQSRA